MDNAVILQDVSIIIATASRSEVFLKTIQSISEQSYRPAHFVVVDASEDERTKDICTTYANENWKVVYQKANQKGAAIQRSQGVKSVETEFVMFMDDDIILKENCIHHLYSCIKNNSQAGGANAMIINQYYHEPGKITSMMYRIMNGSSLPSYSGRCIGPAWNLLPAPADRVQEVEWLNTTCTIYRKSALPDTLFPELFQGYSLMEDLALSLEVAKNWKLYNVPAAKIYHDSQLGDHKRSVFKLSRMEMFNRHFIMTKILHRTGLKNHLKLLLLQVWNISTSLKNANGWKQLFPMIGGKMSALFSIMSSKGSSYNGR